MVEIDLKNEKNAVLVDKSPENSYFIEHQNENRVAKLFRQHHQITEQTIQLILQHEIDQKDISALNEKDLELFGIENRTVILELINQFSNLPKQDKHFERYKSELETKSYQDNVISNINQQLDGLYSLLSVTNLIMEKPNIIENRLIKPNEYVTVTILKGLGMMKNSLKSINSRYDNNISLKWTCGLATAAVSLFCLIKIMNN